PDWCGFMKVSVAERFRSTSSLIPHFSVLLLFTTILTACGSKFSSDPTGTSSDSTSDTVHLSASDVQTIIAQAATQAQAVGLPVTIAVVDHEGTVLGMLQMAHALTTTTINGGGNGGLEGQTVPASAAAQSKAGTPAFFSTQGNAFSTRSASF